MNINKTKLIYFSPTETTKKVMEGVAAGINADSTEHLNLTSPQNTEKILSTSPDELVIIGAPVYAGRLPNDAVKRFRQIKADNTPAVLIVVYGNREFEDALLELKDLAIELGFCPIAAGAFIGEHSFATNDIPIANGRPDSTDLQKAKEFGTKINEIVTSINETDKNIDLPIPGNYPHRNGAQPMGFAPAVNKDTCTKCGLCVTVCPTAAISLNDSIQTAVDLCIQCCACIKKCPVDALSWQDDKITGIAHRLNSNCQTRKEPQYFGINK